MGSLAPQATGGLTEKSPQAVITAWLWHWPEGSPWVIRTPTCESKRCPAEHPGKPGYELSQKYYKTPT